MHIQVALRNLKFGHEAPNHPGNARTAGREDGIAELAAHINARGKIDDLLVYDDGVEDIYFVANGNRSLAALRMIYGETSSEQVDCKLTTAEQAYEDSLAVAVLVKKFHPVDEYEGFALLKERGKTDEEIARQYGKTAREVDQALALGHLSPGVREAWRRGEINAKAAKAFTLADSHKAQDDALAQLRADLEQGFGRDLDDNDIKEILKIDTEVGALVEFIGIEAYVSRGGKVTPDLFGTDHKVSDPKLANKMADEKLADECKKLKETGWSFAVTRAHVRNTHWEYGRLKAESEPTDEEQAKLDQLEAAFRHTEPGSFDPPAFKEMVFSQQAAFLAHRALELAIKLRAFTPAMMAKAGCIVELDHDGALKIDYGRVKPAKKEEAAKVEKEERKEQKKTAAKAAKSEGKEPPAPTTLSNALKERLEMWLVAATRDAIAGEPQLTNSPLFEILAKVACAQIVPDRSYGTPDAIRTKFPSIRQALNPGIFNAALYKRFDAEDYFSSAPRGLVIRAIAEAINPDEARKAATGKSKAEIWKFALANLGKTGWLPKELRTVHYKGPGSEGYKRPAAEHSAATPDLATAMGDALDRAKDVRQAKADRATKAGENKLKRAAVAKKPAKKTAKR